MDSPSASGEILQQFVAASIVRHDGERKCVTAENLTIVKTVTEITTDLEVNLKGLDAPTEKNFVELGSLRSIRALTRSFGRLNANLGVAQPRCTWSSSVRPLSFSLFSTDRTGLFLWSCSVFPWYDDNVGGH